MVSKLTDSKPRSAKQADSSDNSKPRNNNPITKKRLNLDSPQHKTPEGKSSQSPRVGALNSSETRSRCRSEGDKKNVVLHSTFATTPTENPSLLQVSLVNRTPGLSPLAVSPLAVPLSDTEAESSEQSSENNTSQTSRPKKATVIESLEGMLKARFAEAAKPTNDLINNIQQQLNSLSGEIKSLKNSTPQLAPNVPPLSLGHPPYPGPPLQKSCMAVSVDMSDITLKHRAKHIEDMIENFITPDDEKRLMDLLEKEKFTHEGNRETIQYGQHYRYMGSKTHPQPMPNLIKDIMGRLNTQFASSHPQKQFHYELNSCLINRFASGSETLPEHSDNEGDINRQSSIFTISIGSSRTVHFRDISSNETTEVKCPGRSMYHMTRASQEFFRHSVKQEDSGDEGVRYSLTFRSVHWSNFNSTVLVGDSNFGPIHFGSGRGKMGQATPGVRLWAATVEDIDPMLCVGYRNVVIMEGTNNLKLDKLDENGIVDLYKKYKTKIAQIRKYNPRCKLMLEEDHLIQSDHYVLN
ncbi:hypothetical protein ACHWQZ_G005307 [Mnemiopsis leidyi]